MESVEAFSSSHDFPIFEEESESKKVLGQGGSGTVYQETDDQGRLIAVKAYGKPENGVILNKQEE